MLISKSITQVLTKIQAKDHTHMHTHNAWVRSLTFFSDSLSTFSLSLSLSLSLPSLVRWHPVCSVTLSCHLPLPASHLCPLLGQPRHGTQTPRQPSQPVLLRWHENWQQWTSLSVLSLTHFDFSICNYFLKSPCVFFMLAYYLRSLQQDFLRRRQSPDRPINIKVGWNLDS